MYDSREQNISLISKHPVPVPFPVPTMAVFAVSYTGKYYPDERWHKSAKEGATPYSDYLSLKCPTKAAFKFTKHMMDDVLTIIFDPNLSALYFDIRCDYWSASAVAIVQVDSATKRLRITAANCKAKDIWPEINGYACPHGVGGARFMRKILSHVSDLDVLGIAARQFFGSQWSFVTPIKRGTIPDMRVVEAMRAWDFELEYSRGPWNKTTAHFDTTDTEIKAATRIQAAFKGWQARMKYRYNPYTNLGRYVALRHAEFI